MSRTLTSSVAAGFLVMASALGVLLAGGGRPDMMSEMGSFSTASGHFSAAAEMVWAIFSAIPDIPGELASAFAAIVSPSPAGGHPAAVIAIAAGICLLVIAMPTLVDRVADAWVQRTFKCRTRFSRALRLIGFDIAAFVISAAIALLLVHLLFDKSILIGKFAVILVGAAVQWRLLMLAPQILLRPSDPDLRLIPVDDARARLGTGATAVVLALGIFFTNIVPVLLLAGLQMRSAQGIALIVGTLMAIIGAYGLYRFLQGTHRLVAFVGQLLIFMVWLAWSAGVTMLNFEFYHALVWSMAVIAATIGVDRLLALAIHRDEVDEAETHEKRILIIATLRRIVLAVAGTFVLGMVARLWLVDILEVVSQETWGHVRQAIITALSVLVAGYVAFEMLRAWTQAKFGHHYRAAFPGADDEEATPASRLSSVLPVLQGVLGVMIIATAVLLALSHLGINVAPLIAGAGIFGLAISFGSQALVRDIVAGLFYMFDDAFRVGEYIEAGKHKGTVERIALRSVRLRHQNGQIHTLPYGQLGAVTNYSRDYSTVKFNLRLTRDTDVDKVRKLVKKLGQEMLEDPDIGKEFIQPLKLQGLADIQENALVCRFKLTVRPNRPTIVQRTALNRLYKVLVQNGVEFASNAVVVQAPPGVAPEMAAAAVQAIAPQPERGSAAAAPAEANGSPATRG